MPRSFRSFRLSRAACSFRSASYFETWSALVSARSYSPLS